MKCLSQVSVSFFLVIIGMIYYKKPEDGQITECGSLLPDWKSVSAIFSFYTIVVVVMVLANIWFIRQTRKEAAADVSIWFILTHPALRLVLSLFAFFITCAFSAPTDDPAKTTTLQYVTRISMWIIQAMLVVDSVFFLFFLFCIVRREIDWLKMGTHVWTARQFIILQAKFTIIVCYLSTHINVVILTTVIFFCNVFVYVIWKRLMSTSRQAKQKYSNPDYEDEKPVIENNEQE